jgi:cytochrome c-type biogenesis protein CcmH
MKGFKQTGLLVLVFAIAVTGVAKAQEQGEGVTDDDVNRVARELYCPICENTPLDVCETQACEDWRQEIREKLEAGQSEEEIIDYFAGIYGERARATPTNPIIWTIPIIGAIIGVGYFGILLRRWLARGAAAEGVQAPSTEASSYELAEGEPEVGDYVARLEQEIRESS